jgi:hypothetical protein
MDEIRTEATAALEGLALPVASKADKSFLRGAIELKERRVPMPEWERTIVVREMTAAEMREYQLSNIRFDKAGNPRGMLKDDVDLRLVARTCVDERGVRVFGEDDFALLRKQPAAVIARLVRAAKDLSGLNTGDEDDADAIAEQEKNG